MAVHLLKLSVGTTCIADLQGWQDERLAVQKRSGVRAPRLFHRTGNGPKRREELLDGGSIYWIIKGMILVRQALAGFDDGTKEDGSPCCLLLLDRTLAPVRPVPRRPFQGWRYLEADMAPPDIRDNGTDTFAAMPPAMRKELAVLGLL